MNPRTIKALDYWCGVPLCFIATLCEKVRHAFSGRRNDHTPPSRVLFLKLIEQGATVLAYAALTRAVETCGRDNVFFCVFPENRPILDVLDIIPAENVIEIRHRNPAAFAWDAVRFFVQTRRLRIDAVVDMEFFSRASALLCWMSGATARVGYHRFTSELPYRGDLMTHRVQYNPYIHTADAYLLLVKALTLPPTDRPLPKVRAEDAQAERPRFTPAESQKQRVTSLVRGERAREPGRPFIIINPNASDMLPLRKWGAGQFVQLARTLLETYDAATIVLTGSPSEGQAVGEMFKDLPSDRIVNLAGKTDLTDLVTLYDMADVLVTNDSGPGHFAALTDIPSVVLFGPETPRLFGPLGAAHVIYQELACSPCVNVFNHRFSPCNNNVCMTSITVETVLAEVQQILQPTFGNKRT
jgi:ADP-heptose:LPS heptosyltransferase